MSKQETTATLVELRIWW